jgi:hypothetical protein
MLSLTRWSSQIHAGFLGPGATWEIRTEAECLSCTGFLPSMTGRSRDRSTRHQLCNSVKHLVPLLSTPTTPNRQRHQALPPVRFRLIPFRSPLLRESLLLSFPVGTEMFQFPTFPLPVLCVRTRVTPHDGCRVSPFGHPRIEAL